MADANSPWERIQQGVTETERLIGQKQYNMAMIKSRQTLEIMRIFDSSLFALVQETLYLSHFRLIFLSNLCLLYCVLYRTVL